MIINAGEVPDGVLEALLKAAPDDPGDGEGWRQALAPALTTWEAWQRSPMPTYASHECTWKMRGVKHQKVLGLSQTFVLQRCEGCGEVKTLQLAGEWDIADLER